MFSRIAIVNRGEAAMRLIHAVRELNAEPGASPIETIALYTDGERGATFVDEPHRIARLADHELWMVVLSDPDDHLLALMAERPLTG